MYAAANVSAGSRISIEITGWAADDSSEAYAHQVAVTQGAEEVAAEEAGAGATMGQEGRRSLPIHGVSCDVPTLLGSVASTPPSVVACMAHG